VAGGRLTRLGVREEFVREEGGLEGAYLRAAGGGTEHVVEA
jgi:hypothetical protein